MTKHYCDKCQKEIGIEEMVKHKLFYLHKSLDDVMVLMGDNMLLCTPCYLALLEFLGEKPEDTKKCAILHEEEKCL